MERYDRDNGVYIPEERESCNEGKWSPCGNSRKTIEQKKACNMYECPYHKDTMEDHLNIWP
jgi:hypothetical protein